MNLERRAALIETIRALESKPDSTPVVSLEDFFEGNDDLGSIGCNLPHHPGLRRFYDLLAAIRVREGVQDVLVGIYEVVEDDASWPFSETVYILTRAEPALVREWVAELEPDEVEAGFPSGEPPGIPALRQGMLPVRLWWD